MFFSKVGKCSQSSVMFPKGNEIMMLDMYA